MLQLLKQNILRNDWDMNYKDNFFPAKLNVTVILSQP